MYVYSYQKLIIIININCKIQKIILLILKDYIDNIYILKGEKNYNREKVFDIKHYHHHSFVRQKKILHRKKIYAFWKLGYRKMRNFAGLKKSLSRALSDLKAEKRLF